MQVWSQRAAKLETCWATNLLFVLFEIESRLAQAGFELAA